MVDDAIRDDAAGSTTGDGTENTVSPHLTRLLLRAGSSAPTAGCTCVG